MPSAAWRPSQIAVTTRSEPRTMSPPAKIFGLVVWNLIRLMLLCDHAIPVIGCDAGIIKPGRRVGLKAKGYNHRIRFQHLLTAWNRLGAAPAIRIRLAQLGLNHLYTTGLAESTPPLPGAGG